jgi:hypothetical protein
MARSSAHSRKDSPTRITHGKDHTAMTGNITPITTASDGESAAGRQPQERKHGLAVLRADEAKALISLTTEAMSQAHSVGHEMHTLIYAKDGPFRPDKLDCLLTEALACWETADHYLRMLGSVLADYDPRSDSVLAGLDPS